MEKGNCRANQKGIVGDGFPVPPLNNFPDSGGRGNPSPTKRIDSEFPIKIKFVRRL